MCAFAVCLALGIGLLTSHAQSAVAVAEETDPNAHEHTDDGWQSLTADGTLSNGNYYLDDNITGNLTIIGDVTLCLNGYVLHGNGSGSVIRVSNNANFTLCDCNGSNSTHYYTEGTDGLWTVTNTQAGADGSITGGVIIGGNAANGGGVEVDGGEFTMEGGTIAGNTADYGSGVYVDGGTFTMESGTISGNKGATRGGGVDVEYNGTFKMYGGDISGNTVGQSGGDISGSTIGQSGGDISGSTIGQGGGVYVWGTFEMYGGDISDNTADQSGGGVYISGDSEFTMIEGTISDNTAPSGSGVFIHSSSYSGIFNMKGGYFGENKLYTSSGTVNITGGYFATQPDSSYINSTYTTLQVAPEGSAYPYAVVASNYDTAHTHTGGTAYTALSYTGGRLENDTYYLPADITLENNLTISGTVTLCLNGHVLTGTGNGSVITVNSDANFTLCDCNGSQGTHYYTEDVATGLWTITDEPSGSDGSISGGVITGGTGKEVYNGLSYTFGGGVYVESNTKFTMEGGTIAGNSATEHGGGVYVSDGTFSMEGGTIAGNTADYGGGVYVDSSTFAMSGNATISNNMAGRGGGVEVHGTFNMEGGTISDNTADQSGGVYVSEGKFNMEGGTISGNTANYGGGVYVYSNARFTMEGGAISGNTANYGGGVYVWDTFNMEGGAISGNTATSYGGGVYVYGTFTMEGGYFGTNAIDKNVNATANIYGGYFAGQSTITDKRWLTDEDGNTYILMNADTSSDGYREGYPYQVVSTAAAPVKVEYNGEDTYYGTIGEAFTYANELTGTDENNRAEITLLQNCTTSSTLTINSGKYITLDLNGYMLRATEGSLISVITVNGNFELKDTANSLAGRHAYYVDSDDKYVFVTDTSDSNYTSAKEKGTINGGVITGGNTTGNGGGVYMYVGNAIFTMEGGTIAGNTAIRGGGVYVENGNFTMEGGTIAGNSAEYGGGVQVSGANYGIFTMENGTIAGNSAEYGGGVYVTIRVTFTMRGGYFGSNSIHVAFLGTVSITGGYFAVGNTANNTVAGLAVADGLTVVDISAGDHYGDEDFVSGYSFAAYATGDTSGYKVENVETTYGGTYSTEVTNPNSVAITYSYGEYSADTFAGLIEVLETNSALPIAQQFIVTATFPPTLVIVTGENASKTYYAQIQVTFSVTINKAEQTAPTSGVGYTIDFKNETIIISDGYEVYTAQEGGTKITSGSSITEYIGQTVYIRFGETDTHDSSDWTAITVPARPEATVPALSGTAGANGFTVSAVSGQMYAITTENTAPAIGGEGWSAATGSTFEFSGLSAGEVYYVWTYTPYSTGSFNSLVTAALTVKTLPVITTETLDGGTYGAEYSAALEAESADTVTWSIASGSLPAGLSLNESTGVISGTPTMANTDGVKFTVRTTVNDVYAEQELIIVVGKRTITVTISTASSVYGDTPATLSATVTSGSVLDGDTAYSLRCEVGVASNAGFYDITGKVENSNYAITFANGQNAYEVQKREVTVTITPNDGIYGSVTAAIAALQNLVNDDDPTVTLTYTGTDNAGNDYNSTTVPTNAGTYTVTVSITDGNYKLTGDVTATFVISKATYDMSGVSFVDAVYTYDGSEKTLVITGTLPAGVTVEYTANTLTNAGSVTVTASFIGDADNYNAIADMTATLKIDPKNITGATVTLGTALTYNGQQQEQTITSVVIDGLAVTYEVSGNVAANAGDYVLTVTGSDNFTGTATADWNIAKRALTANMFQVTGSYVYTGAGCEATYTFSDGDGNLTMSDFGVTYSNNVNAGNSAVITFTATDSGNYSGSVSLNFTIEKATYDMSGISFGNATYTYDGTEKTLVITGELPSGVIVSYTTNTLTNAGSLEVTASFTGDTANYNAIADMTATLTINKATYNMSGISFENATYTYDGNEKTLVISGTLPSGVTVTYTTNTLTNAGSIEVTASFTGDADNYNAIADMTATLTIEKATYDMSGIKFEDVTYTYDGSEKTLVITGNLPDGVTVSYTTNTLTNAGSVEVTASFMGDTDNYNAIADMTATITVDKATYDISGVKFEDATYTYDGEDKTLTISGTLPDGVTVSYTTNTLTNAGSIEVTAMFTGDANNYNTIAPMTATLTIEKATPEYTMPDGLTAVTGQTLDEIELPDGWSWQDGTLSVGEAGENTFTAVYTPVDTDNYNVVTVEINVTVEQATDNTIHYIIWGCIAGIAVVGAVIGWIIVVCVKKRRAKNGE